MPTTQHAQFGSIRRLRSGRHQVRYLGPDGVRHPGHTDKGATRTFSNATDARNWLDGVRVDVDRGQWCSPTELRAAERARQAAETTLGEYIEQWMAYRSTGSGARNLSPRTQYNYRNVLKNHILPDLKDRPLSSIRPRDIRHWHGAVGARTGDSAQAAAYSLLRSILATAAADELIPDSPCTLVGASFAPRKIEIDPPTIEQLALLVEALPAEVRMLALLGGWCALRSGELRELRRGDFDMDKGTVHITRALSYGEDVTRLVKAPKSKAGRRTVAVPPHLLDALQGHLDEYVGPEADALLFRSPRQGAQLSKSTLWNWFDVARRAAGLPHLRVHDLRHLGAVLATRSGASLAQVMGRLGHKSLRSAIIYQHFVSDQDREIAQQMSALVGYVPPPAELAASA
jgi:integrase